MVFALCFQCYQCHFKKDLGTLVVLVVLEGSLCFQEMSAVGLQRH